MMLTLDYVIFQGVIMLSKELISKSVEELAPLIENKTVSPVELTKAVLDHAETNNEQINAYINISRQDAETSAEKAEEEIANGNYRGMYHGIPMGIKDNIYFKDEITTMTSKINKNFVSDYDTTVVNKKRVT